MNLSQEIEKRATVTGKHALRPDELRRVLEATDDPRRRSLIATAAGAGLRRKDMVNLEVSNLSTIGDSPRAITIDYHEHKKGRAWRSWLAPDLARHLLTWLQLRDSPTRWVWPSTYNHNETGHISGKTAYNWFQSSLDAAGLNQRPFHALRSTCIKILHAQGWNDQEISEQTGDTIRVIRRHYLTPTEQEMTNRTLQTRFLTDQPNDPDG
jgi:integrase